MSRFLLSVLLLGGMSSLFAGSEPPLPALERSPRRLRIDRPVIELASAFQRKIASPNANFQYRVATQMLTLKTPGYFQRPLLGGTFTFRHTATLLGEAIYKGPETHYLGVAARPSFEWWPKREDYYLFFSPGGGLGALDSRGVEGGQGQDFTFNILVDGGVGIFLNESAALKVGVQYHHFSNGGQTDPNPGLNVLGLELGIAVFF